MVVGRNGSDYGNTVPVYVPEMHRASALRSFDQLDHQRAARAGFAGRAPRRAMFVSFSQLQLKMKNM